jgi:hypothetical protein
MEFTKESSDPTYRVLEDAVKFLREEAQKQPWIDPNVKPQEGQYCWVAYHPWNNPSNKPLVQAATWRDGLWQLDGVPTREEGGTSYPPIAWMPNLNQPPPIFPQHG